MITHVRN